MIRAAAIILISLLAHRLRDYRTFRGLRFKFVWPSRHLFLAVQHESERLDLARALEDLALERLRLCLLGTPEEDDCPLNRLPHFK